MSEEELQLLITLDDPGDGPEEDTFHLQDKNTLYYWLAQRFQLDRRAEAVNDKGIRFQSVQSVAGNQFRV